MDKVYVGLVDTTGQYMIRSLQTTVKRNIPVEVEKNAEVDMLVKRDVLKVIPAKDAEKFLTARDKKISETTNIKTDPSDEDLKEFIMKGVKLEVISETERGLKVGSKNLGKDLEKAVETLKKDKTLRSDLVNAVAKAEHELEKK